MVLRGWTRQCLAHCACISLARIMLLDHLAVRKRWKLYVWDYLTARWPCNKTNPEAWLSKNRRSPTHVPPQPQQFSSHPWTNVPLWELWYPGKRLWDPSGAQDQGGPLWEHRIMADSLTVTPVTGLETVPAHFIHSFHSLYSLDPECLFTSLLWFLPLY